MSDYDSELYKGGSIILRYGDKYIDIFTGKIIKSKKVKKPMEGIE